MVVPKLERNLPSRDPAHPDGLCCLPLLLIEMPGQRKGRYEIPKIFSPEGWMAFDHSKGHYRSTTVDSGTVGVKMVSIINDWL